MKKIIVIASLFFAFGISVMAKDKVFTSFLGGAISGYDPVAYFIQSSKYQPNGMERLGGLLVIFYLILIT